MTRTAGRAGRRGGAPRGQDRPGGPAAVTPALPPRVRLLILAAYLLIAAAVTVDLATGPTYTFSPLLAAVPVLASTGARRPAVPLAAGGVALLLVVVLSLLNSDVSAVVHITAGAAVLAVTFTSAATVVLVRTRERELATVRTVAEAAQRALLRPVPARVGPLRVAVRYVAAAAESRIGGDLYEVVDTPFGVRLLLGDVRGKGLAAVETVADVLGVFRDAARSEPDLSAVAVRLDAALARRPGDERQGGTPEFVTAVLVGVPGPGRPAVVVNCGHPPPLLLRGGAITEVRPARFAPPLALLGLVGGGYPAAELAMEPGDGLVLYTDGVSEARDRAGRFYPLAGRLAALPDRDPDALVDALLADVRAYTGRAGPADDVAVLVVRREE
ncbi:PP2C family protein-serine/threonine phosphatase [Streptomyces sp. SL13]|uniref:PP2C family protein-serine/threonine phosphatase n=1 Tax=Streptantibioticus silvisoli TaxID=2705255 RepID=A0AA90H2V2_9ACTN|nr:PP2C family protein-serine/threonine phosphatase [Streptantibioticus silvisoli]MDI5972399.1 PP2C family protein-serine/threonine phosphatase [Streptantibioticus silvisoli]